MANRPRRAISGNMALRRLIRVHLPMAPNTRNGQQIIRKVAKDTESRHKDYPGCAALASSNCAYPYVR